MKDCECMVCGEMHESFGTIPLCERCTREHAAHLPDAPVRIVYREMPELGPSAISDG